MIQLNLAQQGTSYVHVAVSVAVSVAFTVKSYSTDCYLTLIVSDKSLQKTPLP